MFEWDIYMLWLIKTIICIWNGIWMILWYVDLIILATPRITSQFEWVELASFVSYFMDCTCVESYIHMNVGEIWCAFHKIQ